VLSCIFSKTGDIIINDEKDIFSVLASISVLYEISHVSLVRLRLQPGSPWTPGSDPLCQMKGSVDFGLEANAQLHQQDTVSFEVTLKYIIL
jgi:hypothetical protein